MSRAVTATPAHRLSCQRALRAALWPASPSAAGISRASYPAWVMAAMTAGIFFGTAGSQRMRAVLAVKETVALRTPGTPWPASVTWRAQLLQVMPSTRKRVSGETSGMAGAGAMRKG